MSGRCVRGAAARGRIAGIAAILEERYPDAACALEYGGDGWRLLVMGRLSAQCTDARVNLISRPLFAKYPNAAAMAGADRAELEDIVRSCGLYHTKARDLMASCALLVGEYGGTLPGTMEELLRFPGVGRKIANLLLGDLFGKPAVVADTHCIRLAERFGFCPEGGRDPLRTERTLTPLLSAAGVNATDFCHRLVFFGREVCTARRPACGGCPVGRAGFCRYAADKTDNAEKTGE